jgi:hypothetical protein
VQLGVQEQAHGYQLNFKDRILQRVNTVKEIKVIMIRIKKIIEIL